MLHTTLETAYIYHANEPSPEGRIYAMMLGSSIAYLHPHEVSRQLFSVKDMYDKLRNGPPAELKGLGTPLTEIEVFELGLEWLLRVKG